MGYGLTINEFMTKYHRQPMYDLRGWVWCRNCESCPNVERTENGFLIIRDTVKDPNGERTVYLKRWDGALVCPVCGSSNIEVPENCVEHVNG